MTLSDNYLLVYGQLPQFFKKIAEGQAPPKFTIQYLKDLGFSSTNFRAVIPLLKSLGFLSADGTPTTRYHDYRDHSQSRRIMAQALREAYSDLFTIKAHPTTADRALIEGKFKSAHNANDRLAKLMSNVFYSLLALADLDSKTAKEKEKPEVAEEGPPVNLPAVPTPSGGHRTALHYNIQIHLPATKDVEVFNAIFKSLKEHLLD